MHNRLLFLAALMLATACSDSNVGSNNSPPEATITEPSVGSEVLEGSEVAFVGLVDDRGTRLEELEVIWTSSIDGALHDGLADSDGNTTFATALLGSTKRSWFGFTVSAYWALTLSSVRPRTTISLRNRRSNRTGSGASTKTVRSAKAASLESANTRMPSTTIKGAECMISVAPDREWDAKLYTGRSTDSPRFNLSTSATNRSVSRASG